MSLFQKAQGIHTSPKYSYDTLYHFLASHSSLRYNPSARSYKASAHLSVQSRRGFMISRKGLYSNLFQSIFYLLCLPRTLHMDQYIRVLFLLLFQSLFRLNLLFLGCLSRDVSTPSQTVAGLIAPASFSISCLMRELSDGQGLIEES